MPFLFLQLPLGWAGQRERQHVVFWPDGPTRNTRSWGAVSGTATRWRQATQAAPGSAVQCWKLRVLVMPGSPWLALHGAAGHSIRLSETSEAFCSSARIPASGCLAWHRWYSSVPGAVRRSQPGDSAEGQHPDISRAAGAIGPRRAPSQATHRSSGDPAAWSCAAAAEGHWGGLLKDGCVRGAELSLPGRPLSHGLDEVEACYSKDLVLYSRMLKPQEGF